MPYLPTPYQPNNWNSYPNFSQQMYPSYQQGMGSGQPMSQTTQQAPGLIWVDGEVGAKAYQMPPGFPAGQPIALWDTNDTVIYLKSTNAMGMPNPLQKARYKLEGVSGNESSQRFSGESSSQADMSEYVKKDDLERMKQEIMEALGNSSAGNSSRRQSGKGE